MMKRWLPCSQFARFAPCLLLIFYSFLTSAADEAPSASQDTRVCEAFEKFSIPINVSGGFLIFALSMGRYGNQMEHLLGSLAEAKRRAPNRIIVLPSFVVWRYGRGRRNAHIPVEAVFDMDTLKRDFHSNIVSFDKFIELTDQHYWTAGLLCPSCGEIWSDQRATMYCNSAHKDMEHFRCLPDKRANYWRSLKITFTKEYFYEGDIFSLDPESHPVIIVKNALSAPFPMRPQDRYVAKYLKWTDRMEERRQSFLTERGITADDRVVAAHLRAGSDWVKACENAVGRDSYMASPQCSEEMERHNMSTLTLELCLPTADINSVASDLKTAAQNIRKKGENSRSGGRVVLFIATDVQGLGERLWVEHHLGDTYDLLISTTEAADAQPHSDGVDALMEDSSLLDLIVMTHADYLLGNCVSSFTSFAARIRKEQKIGLGTEFFGLL